MATHTDPEISKSNPPRMPEITGRMPEQDLIAAIPEVLPEPGEPGPAERGMPPTPTAARSPWAVGFGEVDEKALALAVLIRAALKDDAAPKPARSAGPRRGGVWAAGFSTADAAESLSASKPSYARRQRSRRTLSSPNNTHVAGTFNS